MIEKGTRRRLLSIIKLLGEAHHRSGEARFLVPSMHLTRTDKDKRWIGDEILPEIGKKASPTINPENLVVGMPVKTKPVGPAGISQLSGKPSGRKRPIVLNEMSFSRILIRSIDMKQRMRVRPDCWTWLESLRRQT